MAAFRNVMKVVRDDGLIDVVPNTPRVTVRDNPRPFFRFHPLVHPDADEYKKLLVQLGQTEWQKPPGEYQKWAGEFYVSERSLVERAKLLRQP